MNYDLYEVFGINKFQSKLSIYLGGVHEGLCTFLILDNDKPIRMRSQFNCDCIRCVSKLVGIPLDAPAFKPIAKTIHKIWRIHENEYSFPKCWHCYDDSEQVMYCNNFEYIGDFGDSFGGEIYDYNSNSFPSIECQFKRYNLHNSCLSDDEKFELIELHSLKDFDVTDCYSQGVRFVCNLNKVNTPKLVGGELHQKIVIGDDSTKKTISCEFVNSLANYDKWEKGQRVEVFGEYNSYNNPPFKIYGCRIIQETSKKSASQSNIRNTSKYSQWVDKVKEVGECYICGRTNHLEAHHINSVADFPEQALDESNGVCLCKSCHNVYHEDYSNTGDAKSFMEFVVKYKRK